MYSDCQAEKDQLLSYEIHIDEKDKPHISAYFDEIQHLYHRVRQSVFSLVFQTLVLASGTVCSQTSFDLGVIGHNRHIECYWLSV